ncbi:MAG: adenylate/guanylate cyclase domain-containing protein [Spirochaetes bacterium]|nr:adenylate/guanylate cyclase domain-containing protein [Spirochaetota bacterium]
MRKRERSGLIVSILLSLAMAAGLTLGHISTHHSKLEVVWVSGATAMITVYLLILLYYILKDRHLLLMGYLSQLPAIFIMVFLPYTWYTSVGGYANVPATYLMKTSLPIWAYILILISGLALRPAYPLIVAGGFIGVWITLFQIAMRDTRTVITADFLQNAFSAAIIPEYTHMYALGGLLIGLILAWITYSYRKSIHQAARLEVATNELGRYFSPAVRDTIVSQQTTFGGNRLKAAVLFSDIRGFTAMSEKLSAEETMNFLRDYHGRMVEIIYRHGGTVDKFIGDGIMVTFGTPVPAADDAERAVRCVTEMLAEVKRMNTGKAQPIRIGVGIEFGEVVVGNVGSANWLEYTVIGDTVNTASRIEAATKDHGVEMLFSEAVKDALPDRMATRFVSEVGLRGKSAAVRLFTVA